MSLLSVILVLIAIGVILYLINRYIPMQGTIKTILNAVVVIALVIWLLKVAGVWGEVASVQI